MLSNTIRVSSATHDTVRTLARTMNVPMQTILDQAVEVYRRQQLLDATNAAYAELRTDAVAWQEIQMERAMWDETLADGLEDL